MTPHIGVVTDYNIIVQTKQHSQVQHILVNLLTFHITLG